MLERRRIVFGTGVQVRPQLCGCDKKVEELERADEPEYLDFLVLILSSSSSRLCTALAGILLRAESDFLVFGDGFQIAFDFRVAGAAGTNARGPLWNEDDAAKRHGLSSGGFAAV